MKKTKILSILCIISLLGLCVVPMMGCEEIEITPEMEELIREEIAKLQGEQGEPGPAGPQGGPGLAGPAGPQGERGPQGLAGTAGPAGPAGSQGEPGPQGEVGPSGSSGSSGSSGPQGPAGAQGAQGEQGEQGEPGIVPGVVISYTTIQDAIDAAEPGATINVPAGTYNLESPIVVDESVTLTGDIATPSNVVIDASGISGDDRDCFQVKASNVTIQGFTIQGALDAPGSAAGTQNSGIVIGAWWAGAAISGLQNITISHNDITGNSKGISVYCAQHVVISENHIHDSPTNDVRPGSWPGKGVMLYGDGSGVQNNDIDILNNYIYNNAKFGIELNHWDTTTGAWVDVDVLIDGNKIYDNGGPFDYEGWAGVTIGRGISANGHETGVTITNNEIYGHWSTGAVFYHNAAGIRPNDSKGFVISDNDVHDNMRGIYIYGTDTTFGDENTGFVVTGNDVHNNAQGIVFGDGDVGYAHLNNIYDNDVATYTADGVSPCGAVNLGPITFDATQNWWGTVVEAGILAMVSGDVDYGEWLLVKN